METPSADGWARVMSPFPPVSGAVPGQEGFTKGVDTTPPPQGNIAGATSADVDTVRVTNVGVVSSWGELLVVAVGSRDGKRPPLAAMRDGGSMVDLLLDKANSARFPSVAKGLRSYAQFIQHHDVSG